MRHSGFLILLLLFFSCANAQLPYASLLYPLGESQEHTITRLYQDPKGYLWIGTTNGLYVFNGFESQRIGRNDSLTRNIVSSLHTGRSGTLWVGYDNGDIDTVAGFRLRAFLPEEGTPKTSITSIVADSAGRIWFSTSGEGIYLWDHKRLYNINRDDGLPDNNVYALLPNGASVWAGTDRGLVDASFENEEKKLKVYNKSNGLPDDVITALAYDENKKLWLGLLSNGVVAFNKNFPSLSESAFTGWDKGRVRRMTWINGRCWMTTDFQGIHVFDPDAGTVYPQAFQHSFTGRYSDVLSDRERLVWASAGNRLYKTTGETLQRYLLINDPRENVQAVLCRKNGEVWYATNKHNYIVKDSSGISHGQPIQNAAVAVDNMLSFYESGGGDIWMGTFGDGLWKMNADGKLSHYTKAHGLPDNGVLCVTGLDDEIWLATLGGICRLKIKGNEVNIERFSGNDAVQTSYVYSIFIDSKKQVWFGTDGNGVRVFSNGRFSNPVRTGKLNEEVVYSIAEDASGRIWLASARNGLYVLSGDSAVNYGTGEGLDDYSINGLVADATGNLVIMHNDGIECLNTINMQFTFYGRLMGAVDLQTGLNAFAMANGRKVWIGTHEGLLSFTPPDASLRLTPLLNLRSVAAADAASDDGGLSGVFPYHQNFLRVSYDGIWNTDPEALVYQYKLEGYSGPDWITTRDRVLLLPRLSQGSYNLNLRAGLVNAYNNATVVTHAFRVKPAWWQTSWFYVLMVLTAIGLVMTIVKIREQSVKQQQRVAQLRLQAEYETLRNQVNPHFLFNSFNTLSGIIEENPDRAVEYVEHLSGFFRNMLEIREKPLVTLREELDMTNDYLYLQQKRFGSNFSIVKDIDVNTDDFFLPPLTMQILMENAFKHNVVSRSSPLRILVKAVDDTLVVTNNVNPKTQKERSTGIGLANVNSRIAMHTTRRMNKELKDGTFTVTVPLIKEANA